METNATCKRIKDYANSKGIKQTAIANGAGMRIDALNASLNGRRRLDSDEYCKICCFLGVPMDFFYSAD